ncbi:MAG: cytidine deaminase-like protein [Benjaminiella poitrasii]|nr:MAG: cytidine deaminase-like protein [Benjaminiella poitrasii]
MIIFFYCILATELFFNIVLANNCHSLVEQKAIDACYMRIALDYAILHNPLAPFGALIVDHTKNEIACYGVNSIKQNVLLHGETAAFWNCTELYPSPTHDDMLNPGLDWSHQTLYTTGEPCPMCASQSIYRGVTRVVWGSSIPDMNKSGLPQIMIRMHNVIATAKLGANLPNNKTPELVGGVLKDECDQAFWCAFAVYRGEKYYKAMAEQGLNDYIQDRENRFKCHQGADGHAESKIPFGLVASTVKRLLKYIRGLL